MAEPVIQMNPWMVQTIKVKGVLTGWSPTTDGTAKPIYTAGRKNKTYEVRVYYVSVEDSVIAAVKAAGELTEEQDAWTKSSTTIEIKPCTYGMAFKEVS